MERWYLLVTENFLFWTFWWWEIRSFFQPKRWWEDDIYVVFLSFLWYSRTWEIGFFAQWNPWPIDWCTCSMYTANLILLGDIFWAAVGLYDICSFWCFCIIFQLLAHFPGVDPRLFIDLCNTQFYCIKKNWHDRRHFYYNFGPGWGHCWSVGRNQPIMGVFKTFFVSDIKLSVNIELASLYFAQNYPSSVSKTLQPWCRVLNVFYRTSLLPLCNVFSHVYERSLKLLEIANISSASGHEPKSSGKFFHFQLQMDVYW